MNKEKRESEKAKDYESETVSAQLKVSGGTMQMLLKAKHRRERETGRPISMTELVRKIVVEGIEEEEREK